MLRSMTAFARIESQHEQGGIQWEIRSVNHRYLDVNLRLPEDLRRLDPKVRERNRRTTQSREGRLHAAGARQPRRHRWARRRRRPRGAGRAGGGAPVAELLPEAAPINPVDVLRWPGVVQAPAPDPELIERLVLDDLDRALADLAGMREREGIRIETVIGARLGRPGGGRCRGYARSFPAIVRGIR